MGIVVVPGVRPAGDQPDCAVVELTLACNCRCLHCGASAGRPRKGELSRGEIAAVAGDLRRIGFRRISLIGGEPFLRSDWYEIASLCRDAGLILTYVSNGSPFCLDAGLIERVLETRPQVVGLSLDGGTAKTHDKIRGRAGSFQEVLRAAELLRERGAQVSVVTTVHRLNLKELPRIRDLLLGKGIAWQIQLATANGCRFRRDWLVTKEEYVDVARFIHESAEAFPSDELPIGGADDIGYFSQQFPKCSVNRDRWDGCKAGRSNLGIASNGDVKGCNALPDAYVEGNVRERGLWDIWNDPHAFRMTRGFRPEMLRGCCAACDLGARCKGGCIDLAHSVSGHAFENPYCLRAQGR